MIERPIVIEVAPQPWWTGPVSVSPAVTEGPIGCSPRLTFRNWATAAGTFGIRAGLMDKAAAQDYAD
jgi:hypothetical protein